MGRIVRVIHVILLRIRGLGSEKNKILCQTVEQYRDSERRLAQRLPGKRLEDSSRKQQLAEKIASEILLSQGGTVNFDWDRLPERFEETVTNPCYPGVITVYRKEIFQGVLVRRPSGYAHSACSSIAHDGFSASFSACCKGEFSQIMNGGELMVKFAWLTEKELAKRQIHYKAPDDAKWLANREYLFA